MKKFDPNEKSEKIRIEYWAVTKDGSRRQKLNNSEEAAKAIKTGKTTFWYEYIEGVRKIESWEEECDVYVKEVTTLSRWVKI
jgi:hypothetical protein